MRYSTSPPKYSPLAQAAEKLVYLSAPLLVIGVLVTRSGKIEPLHGIAVFIVAAIYLIVSLDLNSKHREKKSVSYKIPVPTSISDIKQYNS